MKNFMVFLTLVALVLITAGVARTDDGMVTICHSPPGNREAAITLSVPAPAVPAHLAHGDTLGPCE